METPGIRKFATQLDWALNSIISKNIINLFGSSAGETPISHRRHYNFFTIPAISEYSRLNWTSSMVLSFRYLHRGYTCSLSFLTIRERPEHRLGATSTAAQMHRRKEERSAGKRGIPSAGALADVPRRATHLTILRREPTYFTGHTYLPCSPTLPRKEHDVYTEIRPPPPPPNPRPVPFRRHRRRGTPIKPEAI